MALITILPKFLERKEEHCTIKEKGTMKIFFYLKKLSHPSVNCKIQREIKFYVIKFSRKVVTEKLSATSFMMVEPEMIYDYIAPLRFL